MWNRIKAWWTRADRLEAEVTKLRQERADCVEVLKKIALAKPIDQFRSVYRADRQLKKMGFIPYIEDVNMPPDQMYFFDESKWGALLPAATDYLPWHS